MESQHPSRRRRRRRLLQADAPGEPAATLRGVGEKGDASQRRSGSQWTGHLEGLAGHVPG